MAIASQERSTVFSLPNQLTATRLVLAIILFVCIAYEWWLPCLLVFAAAGLTDYLDGYLARKHGLTSSLGRVFDPLVDKVLVCGAFIFLLPLGARSGLTPWMVTVVVGRELIITGLRSFLETRDISFGADWLGKLKMGLQCAALFGIFGTLYLAEYRITEVGVWDLWSLRDGLNYAMLAATALSGLQYLWRALLLMEKPGPHLGP